MRQSLKFPALVIVILLQGCTRGCSDSGTLVQPVSDGGSEPVVQQDETTIISIADCSDGVSQFQSGDIVSSAMESTQLKMSYAEDGTRSGCVITGAANIERP